MAKDFVATQPSDVDPTEQITLSASINSDGEIFPGGEFDLGDSPKNDDGTDEEEDQGGPDGEVYLRLIADLYLVDSNGDKVEITPAQDAATRKTGLELCTEFLAKLGVKAIIKVIGDSDGPDTIEPGMFIEVENPTSGKKRYGMAVEIAKGLTVMREYTDMPSTTWTIHTFPSKKFGRTEILLPSEGEEGIVAWYARQITSDHPALGRWLEAIPTFSQELLRHLVFWYQAPSKLAIAALERITDQDQLYQLFQQFAEEGETDRLRHLPGKCGQVLERLDQASLTKFVKDCIEKNEESLYQDASKALERINDQAALFSLVQTGPLDRGTLSGTLVSAAIGSLTEISHLGTLCEEHVSVWVRLHALVRLAIVGANDRQLDDLFHRLMLNDPDESIRTLAEGEMKERRKRL